MSLAEIRDGAFVDHEFLIHRQTSKMILRLAAGFVNIILANQESDS